MQRVIDSVSVITSAKKVMFSSALVSLFIKQKLLNRLIFIKIGGKVANGPRKKILAVTPS